MTMLSDPLADELDASCDEALHSVGSDASSEASLNFYVGNNPITCVDPTGLEAVGIPKDLDAKTIAAVENITDAMYRLYDRNLFDGLNNKVIELYEGDYLKSGTFAKTGALSPDFIQINRDYAADAQVPAVAGLLVHEAMHSRAYNAGFVTWAGQWMANWVPWGISDSTVEKTGHWLGEYYNHLLEHLVQAKVQSDILAGQHPVGRTFIYPVDGKYIAVINPQTWYYIDIPKQPCKSGSGGGTSFIYDTDGGIRFWLTD